MIIGRDEPPMQPQLAKQQLDDAPRSYSASFLVSILIITYNSRRYIERCLLSVMRTSGSDYEIIVLDNNSSDGSADYVEQYFPSVRLIRSTHNLGFAMGNNQAAAASRSKYLVALNPDTEVTPGWLEALIEPLRANQHMPDAESQIGLTTARILMMNSHDRVNTCGNIPHYTGITTCLFLDCPANMPKLSRPFDIPAISGACFAIRHDLWSALDGFDDDFFTYLEDTDLSLRARLLGYRCRYAPKAIVYHDYTNAFSASKLYFLERNRAVMLLKLYRWRTLVLLAPSLVLTESVCWCYALRNGRAYILAKIRTYMWIVAHRTAILERRQQVQAGRCVNDRQLLTMLARELRFEQIAGHGAGRAIGGAVNPLFRLFSTFVRTLA